jgi:lipopolysaccharide export system protein LptA
MRHQTSGAGGIFFLLFFVAFLHVLPAVGEEKVPAQLVASEDKTVEAKPPERDDPGASLVDSLSFTSRKEPIHIRSRDLEFRYNDKKVIYRGNVVVTQGEVTLKSDTLTVTYADQQAGKENAQATTSTPAVQQQIKEVVAEGNVDITSGDRRATCKRAVFTETSRTVVLTGDAVLREEGNRAAGEKVTVYIDEKRSVVEGGGGKGVEMVISQQQGGEKKGAKTP